MWVLPALGYIGVIFGFSFLTLAIGTSHSLSLISELKLTTFP